MEIIKAEIISFSLGSLNGNGYDNLKHTKVLPWLSVVQAQEGRYDVGLSNQDIKNASEGGFFIAPAGVQQNIIHHVNAKSGTMRARWLFIDVTINERFSFDSLYDIPTILSDEYRNDMNRVFDLLFSAENIFEKYACCYKVLEILFKVSKTKLHQTNHAMLSAFDFIKKNYMNEIKVGDMARLLNTSESNFYAVFKKHFGMPPIAYLNNFRLSIAEEKLRTSDDSIKSIASSVGINDPIYFNKLFHKYYDISPKEYRSRSGLNLGRNV